MVLWFYGSMVLWFYGSMVLWFYGSMVQWFNGSMVLWFCGSMVQRFYGADGDNDRILNDCTTERMSSGTISCLIMDCFADLSRILH
jgi:hypothetical protein